MTLRRIASVSGLYDDSIFAPRSVIRSTSSLGLLLMSCDPDSGFLTRRIRKEPPLPSTFRTVEPESEAGPGRQPKPTCIIPECQKPVYQRRLCVTHRNYTRTCAADGCDRRIKDQSRTGFCIYHSPDRRGFRVGVVDFGTCAVHGCDESARSNGRCYRHRGYTQTCKHEGCSAALTKKNKGGLCPAHKGVAR